MEHLKKELGEKKKGSNSTLNSRPKKQLFEEKLAAPIEGNPSD